MDKSIQREVKETINLPLYKEAVSPLHLKQAAGILGVISVILTINGMIRGYNDEPGTKGQGITLSNPALNRDLICTRDKFQDVVNNPIFRNKWFHENCPETIKAEIKTALQSDHPLETLTEIRDRILIESGEYPAKAEEWKQSYLGQSNGFEAKFTIRNNQIDEFRKTQRGQISTHSRQQRER